MRQFFKDAIFFPNGIQIFFWKNISFVKNLKMTQIAGGRGVMLFASL